MTGLIPESFYPPNTAAKVLKKWQWDKYYFFCLICFFLGAFNALPTIHTFSISLLSLPSCSLCYWELLCSRKCSAKKSEADSSPWNLPLVYLDLISIVR